MNIDITQVAVALISMLSLVISSVLVPWLKSKTNNEHLDTLKAISQDAVSAMEIFYKGSGQGEIKREQAMQFIEKQCASRGIKLDTATIEIAVETAWKQLNFDKKS